MKHVLIRCLTLLLVAGMLSMAPVAAPALDADEMFADTAQEVRAREIGRQLRCLKCRNQSIFDSNAGIAKDLRVVVRERMLAGDTDSEILTYAAERFGDYVLLKPRVASYTYVLWLAPFFFLIVGGVGIWVYHRRRPAPASAAMLSEAEQQEARRILEGSKP